METTNKPLEKLNIFSVKGVQMRTFHLTWMAFFLCFFGWFGLAPLMTIIKTDLGLTKTISFQGGYCTFLSTNSLAQVKGVKNPQKMSNWAYLMISIKPEFLR